MKRLAKHIPFLVAMVHSLAVVGLAMTIRADANAGQFESVMLWILFFFVDLPMSVLLIPIEAWLGPTIESALGLAVSCWLAYGTFFLVFGGIQWFVISKILCRVIPKLWSARSGFPVDLKDRC